jgi:hypothetical protein
MHLSEFHTYLDSLGFGVVGTGGGCEAWSLGDYEGVRITMSQNLCASINLEWLEEAREEAERKGTSPDFDTALCISLSWPILKDGKYWDDDHERNNTDHDGLCVTSLEEAKAHIEYLLNKYKHEMRGL